MASNFFVGARRVTTLNQELSRAAPVLREFLKTLTVKNGIQVTDTPSSSAEGWETGKTL